MGATNMNLDQRAAVLADLVIKYQELVLVYQARERITRCAPTALPRFLDG